MLLVVCCGGGGIAAIFSLGSSDTKPTAVSDAQVKAQSEVKVVGLGVPARDGKFEFTVESIKCGQTTMGGQYFNVTAQGQYCSVPMTVRNIGDKPQYLDSSSQKAFGAGGTLYGPDASATAHANDQYQFFFQQINPGNQVKGVLVFDIPKGAPIVKLELHDSPFSGGVAITP